MSNSWIIIAIGVSLILTGYQLHDAKSQIRELKIQNEYLTENYKADREILTKAINEQNTIIEQYKVSIEDYTHTISSKYEELVSSTDIKQQNIAKSLSKDNSNENIINETNKLLVSFGNTK